MAPGPSKARGMQPTVKEGMGSHFSSPTKKRNSKRKTQTQAFVSFDHEAKKRKLQAELDSLQAMEGSLPVSSNPFVSEKQSKPKPKGPIKPVSTDFFGGSQAVNHGDYLFPELEDTAGSTPTVENKKRRTAPNQAAYNLHSKWTRLIPSLVDDFLEYSKVTIGKIVTTAPFTLKSRCLHPLSCQYKSRKIICLYFDHFKNITVTSCNCDSTNQILVRNGLFPTSPSQTRFSVSIALLDFYATLFETSCEANERYKDPFRRSLGYAIQWLDVLRVEIENRVQVSLKVADQAITAEKVKRQKPTEERGSDIKLKASSKREECSRELRQLCPACFGGEVFGTSLLDGGDFQICTDGNFHHKRLKSGGENVPFHSPAHIIPKEYVDRIGDLIINARKKTPKKRTSQVPDEAIDECEESYEAAEGDKKRNHAENRYSDMGWMSLICRHDIPLFFANIDTPGEQQKYAVALITWFSKFIPSHSTMTVLYDIGCVLDRSVQMYDILPESLKERVQFVTTAMHAYGHQWSCQLSYNPRLCKGLGLTDGEGVERTWSRLRKLIGIVRTSSHARRLWLTDRQLTAIAISHREDLGDWIKRRYHKGIKEKEERAQELVKQCNKSMTELDQQWNLQKTAQQSAPAHAPARLKKELNSVLTLQSELEAVENAIQTKVDALFASLRIPETYPSLNGVNLEFIQALIQARDLKANIRKRANESFFEYDRLDQAVGGKANPLGTKLHQHTRKAISKRAPALLRAIRKYNSCCETMERLYNPESNLPLPTPLPTKLGDLRQNPSLLEDVCIVPTDEKPQPWLVDKNVRHGIQAMLKIHRCNEEKQRLVTEANNMCCWFGREIGCVELALHSPESNLHNTEKNF
ncbi:hypothetical protein HYPSUDRAFT_67307 [Hypholoma sublateritium FD-334 SS-4]|uniref:CxC1-like cysteine cluster associated with KDZ transposases domain-containing protein n=1 Tax=Hypholoma sublateritium (strain FD-334 SS-4) TaxID=945553 RepID=A0A0D2PQ13_HYPSF|nr:hypothetical protein HYPSUDRAFT_67307 [Hypholoma sublateritium FD-334 SS-4]